MRSSHRGCSGEAVRVCGSSCSSPRRRCFPEGLRLLDRMPSRHRGAKAGPGREVSAQSGADAARCPLAAQPRGPGAPAVSCIRLVRHGSHGLYAAARRYGTGDPTEVAAGQARRESEARGPGLASTPEAVQSRPRPRGGARTLWPPSDHVACGGAA